MGYDSKERAGSFIVLAGIACLAAACLLSTNTTRAAETVTYQYDALGRLTKKTSAGTVNTNKKVTVCYDAAGNRKIYKVAANGAAVVCPVSAP